jgi:integrase
VELAKGGGTRSSHSLRRTSCALLYEADANPAYVMAQMGHTDAAPALEIDSKFMERNRDTGERMDALLRGADWGEWALTARTGLSPTKPLQQKARISRGF